MKKKVVVLGAGMVGSAIARDLAADQGLDVTVVDARPNAVHELAQRFGVHPRTANLANPAAVKEAVAGADLAVGALPSALGLQTIRALIDAGCSAVDISFLPEDPRPLSRDAAAKGVAIVYDCGVAPGLSNMMTGAAASRLEALDRVDICCGGLPAAPAWPFRYKAGFAPHDVLEEYTRPARIVEEGRVVLREALSDPRPVVFEGVEPLEAFLTDGLRSLVDTVQARSMEERTVRYPGHADLMRVFRETGLLSNDPVDVGGARVRPRDLTSALLFPKWTFAEGEADFTVLRVVADGTREGRARRLTWDFVDRFDPASGLRSMSRSTAFPACAVARRILGGEFREPGVHPPEALGARHLDGVIGELQARGVHIAYRDEAS